MDVTSNSVHHVGESLDRLLQPLFKEWLLNEWESCLNLLKVKGEAMGHHHYEKTISWGEKRIFSTFPSRGNSISTVPRRHFSPEID